VAYQAAPEGGPRGAPRERGEGGVTCRSNAALLLLHHSSAFGYERFDGQVQKLQWGGAQVGGTHRGHREKSREVRRLSSAKPVG